MSLNHRPDIELVPLLGLLAAATALAAGVLTPFGVTVDPQIQLVIGVFACTVILWITKPVPYLVSSVLAVVLLFGLGLTDSLAQAATGFSSTLVFFYVLLLLIGKSVAKAGLDDRVARRLVTATSTPRSSVRRMSVAVFLLALVMPSALARTVTFMPVFDRINTIYRLGESSPFRRLGYYILGHANPLASLALMTGGGMAIVTAEMINSMVRPITWIEWAFYMTPPIILLYSAAVFGAGLRYGVGRDRQIIDERSSAQDERPEFDGTTEPLTFDQEIVVVMLAVAIVAWIGGSFVGIPAIIPAMAVVLVFSLPGVGIITATEVRDLSWGIVFLMGAMLSLLDVMRELSAFDLVVDLLFSNVPILQSALFTLFVLFGIAVLIRGTFSSVSAALLLLLPILLEFATILGLDPFYVSLSLPLVLGSAVFLPFNVPTVLIAFERGPLEMAEVLTLGLMTLAVGFLVAALSWVFYWPLLDSVLSGVF